MHNFLLIFALLESIILVIGVNWRKHAGLFCETANQTTAYQVSIPDCMEKCISTAGCKGILTQGAWNVSWEHMKAKN